MFGIQKKSVLRGNLSKKIFQKERKQNLTKRFHLLFLFFPYHFVFLFFFLQLFALSLSFVLIKSALIYCYKIFIRYSCFFISGVGGNLVAVHASRLSTTLHQKGRPGGRIHDNKLKGCLNPFKVFFGSGKVLHRDFCE